MKLTERSYPHPVVGNRDDVPGAGFQATISASNDKKNFYINIQLICGSEEICALVKQERVAYVAHVECGNTIYREAWVFHDNQKTIALPMNRLSGKIEVNVFACAKENISSFNIRGVHEDYGDATFELREGDIIAVAEGEEFTIEAEDALARVGSIMQIIPSSEDEDGPMVIDYEHPKINIILSRNDYTNYQILKRNDQVSKILISIIVLPTLVQALIDLRSDENGSDIGPFRWMENLHRKLERMGVCKDDFDPLAVAQQILEAPVSLAFNSLTDLTNGEM